MVIKSSNAHEIMIKMKIRAKCVDDVWVYKITQAYCRLVS